VDLWVHMCVCIYSVPGGKVNILEGHSIGHSKQKSLYVLVHVYYPERVPRYSYFTIQYITHCTDEQHAMSSHELQSALMLTMKFSKMYTALGKLYQLCHLNNKYRH
jgi:hypothetical protein